MGSKTVHIASVAITTFISWLIITAAIGVTASWPHPLFILVHYALVVLVYGVSFGLYYWGHKGEDPFVVMGISVLSFFVFEIIYGVFLYDGSCWFLNYLDWFVPLFLMSSTTYWVGRFLQ